MCGDCDARIARTIDKATSIDEGMALVIIRLNKVTNEQARIVGALMLGVGDETPEAVQMRKSCLDFIETHAMGVQMACQQVREKFKMGEIEPEIAGYATPDRPGSGH